MAGNRVTHRMLSDTAIRGFQRNLSNNQRIQEQLASQKRINRPSDDPSGTTAAMQLRSQDTLTTQYLSNIDFAGGRLATADNALQDIVHQVSTAKTIAVNAQNSALPDSSRSALAAQLRSIQATVIEDYNATWLGRPIFGGTVPGSAALEADGTYIGNDEPVTARIGRQVSVRTDVSGTAAAAGTLPALLGDLADNIDNGAVDVNGYQDALDAALKTLTAALGDVGARAAQVDGAKARLNTEQVDLRARISEREDVDLPSAAIALQSSQVAYQASLGAAAKVLQTSLLDYLR